MLKFPVIARYGYGLVINTDFGMGKTATLSTLGNKSRGIRKHSSTDDYNYFQGMAVSYKSVSYTHLDVYKRQIQGRSNFVYRIKDTNTFVSLNLQDQYETTPLHVDVNIVSNDILDTEAFKAWPFVLCVFISRMQR